VVLGGPAGIGKSSLLAAIRTTAQARDCSLVWATASWSTRDLPFGALASTLPDGVPRAATVPEVAARITVAAGGRRLAVALDDAPMADPATVATLHLLIQQRQAFVFTTARDGEMLPAPLDQLWRSGSVEWLEVPPLDDAQVRQLACAAVGGPVAGSTIVELAHLSGGNPLFLRELVGAAVEQGLLAERRNLWQLSERPRLTVPLAQLVWQRVGGLPPPVLDVVQLVGEAEQADADVLAAVVDRTALDEAERHGLVRVDPGDRRCVLALTHPLYGEVLRQTRGTLRVRQLRRDLAAALAARGVRRERDALRLARYHLDGNVEVDRTVLARATRQAARAFDHRLTIRLGRAAEVAGASDSGRITVAAAHAWCGEFELADSMFTALERRALSDADRSRLARERVANLVFGLGRVRAARKLVATAKRRTVDPERCAELELLDVAIALNLGRSAEAFRLAATATTRAVSTRLRVRRLPTLVSTLAALGETDAAIDVGERELAQARRSAVRYPYLVGAAEAALAEACLVHGALDRAEVLVAAGYRQSVQLGADSLSGHWALVRARAALLCGRFAEAIDYFRDAAVLLDHNLTLLGRSGVLECRAGLAVGHAMNGDQHSAETALAAADGTVVEGCFSPTLALAHAWTAAARGDRQAGLTAALDAVTANVERGNEGFEAAALHLAVLLGAQPGVADRLAELADRHPGPLRQAYADHALGVVQRDGALLDRAATDFAAIGAWPFAAQAAADAAHAYAADGRCPDAVLAAERSRALLARCPGYRPLQPLGSPDVPALTRRERQVAALAANGMANAEIAGSLVLSVRTVETHLGNVYAKTGKTGRAALRALFPVPAMPPEPTVPAASSRRRR
jgi:DNA-binding CsgD family transcriptional regulator